MAFTSSSTSSTKEHSTVRLLDTVLLERINRLLQEEKFDQALFIIETSYPNYRHDLHVNLLLGEIHTRISQYREAKKYFDRAGIIDQNNFQALYGKGKACYFMGDFNEAVKYLNKSSTNEHYRADVYNDLGYIYEELDEQDKAFDYYNKAITENHGLSFPVLNICHLLISRDQPEKALVFLENYLEGSEPIGEILVQQGVVLEMLNRFQDAIDVFSIILAEKPESSEAYYNRAFCYLKLARIDEARQDLKKYLEIIPDDEQARGLLALTYTLEGKFVDSVDIWKEFLPSFHDISQKVSSAIGANTINPFKILNNIEIPRKNENGDAIKISVVIPVKDEEGSIIILYEKLKNVLSALNQKYEIIFVDDGSSDGSLDILADIAVMDERVYVIKFRKNYGQTAAFAAGFKYASGEVIITMDADLQNDPEDIPRLLEKMSEGYDLVSGWRKDRKDKTVTRKMPSFIANRMINKLIAGSGIHIHDFGCSLKAYKKGIVKNIRLYGEMHRFIPAYAAWLGIRVAEIPVKHHPRKYGYPKYGLERIGHVVLDMITLRFFTGFKTRPLQFFGKIAGLIALVGIIFSIFLYTLHLITDWGIEFQSFLLISLFSVLGGFQFIVVGLLSEIIMRGFLEAQDREEYVVEAIIK